MNRTIRRHITDRLRKHADAYLTDELTTCQAELVAAQDEIDRLLDQSDDDATIIRSLEQTVAEREAAIFALEDLLGLGTGIVGGAS